MKKRFLLLVGVLLCTGVGSGMANHGTVVSPDANLCCRYWDVKASFVTDENGQTHMTGFECYTGGTKTCLDGCECNEIIPTPV